MSDITLYTLAAYVAFLLVFRGYIYVYEQGYFDKDYKKRKRELNKRDIMLEWDRIRQEDLLDEAKKVLDKVTR